MDLSKKEFELSGEVKRKLALPNPKADIGCGLNRHEKEKEEYIYIDGDGAFGIDIVCDWNDIPLPSDSLMEIHTSDTVEHIKTWEYDKTLPEWNRLLKIGGKIWGTTPDRDFVIKCAYEKTKDKEWQQNNLYGHGAGFQHTHYTTFTRESINELFQKYGFSECTFGDTNEWIHFTFTKIKNI